MKKKLVYIFIGIGILLMLLYLFRYKQGLTFTDRVPSTATAIININARQLEHHILADFLRHPITYLKPGTLPKDSVEKPKFSLTKGVKIPKNILFFTNDATLKNAWYSSILEVSNPDELSRYLLTKNFKKNNNLYHRGNFVFALKDTKLIIAITYQKKSNHTEAIQAIFNETDFLHDGSPLLQQLIDSNSDICLTTTKQDFFEANFKDGIFTIQGKTNPNFDLFIATMQPESNQNDIASFTGKINKKHALFKTISEKIKASKFNSTTHLSIDSIFKAWNGKLSFNLKSIESKTDTIITYEYDDDFNKIEKIATQKIAVPKLMLQLGREKNTSLLDYFKNKNAIQVIEKDTLFTVIPLYKFHVVSDQDNFKIYTDNNTEKEQKKNSTSKLNGYISIDNYRQSPQQFAFLSTEHPFFTIVKDASMQISKNNEFLLRINLKDKNRNFLGQYVKSSL